MRTYAMVFSLLSFPSISQGQDPLMEQIVPYGRTTPAEVRQLMDRVLDYVDGATPVGIVNGVTGDKIVDLTKPLKEATLVQGEYNITSHEWGLAYSAMMRAGEITGDARYTEYVSHRFEFLGKASKYFRDHQKAFPGQVNPLEHFLNPGSLDDTGAMCAAMIQGLRSGIGSELRPEIDRSINFIMTKVYRLRDGTFARNRPLPNSVWVDDLYQGIPALAQMGKLTGERKYFDEAARQVFLFSERLFDKEKKVCMHGWVAGMDPQPAFYWARANGWAIMAIAALLDVLPEDHPHHTAVLDLFRSYCHGLVVVQSGSGFWHQLMDRNDSFHETSATAMFTYVLAHGINQGWLDIRSYGAAALLGWNAVSTKVNGRGQVEGTSAGTSMAFDPAFYYQRPVGTGPHGYGSVILAGAAMYKLLKEHPYEATGPVIFSK
ncbi:MAG: glycoside hydrolase family 88 protein [Cyclobacteriaceae bacterium]